jgi:hypothetical protein
MLALRISEDLRRRTLFDVSEENAAKNPHRFQLSNAAATDALRAPIPNVKTRTEVLALR